MVKPHHFRFDLNDPDLDEDMREPPLLYHYTNGAGLTGILDSGVRLQATHHQFVNDSAEIRFGFDIALEILRGLDGLDDDVKHLAESEVRRLMDEPSYLACLSGTRDSLPQWQTYADSVNGYCVGFRLVDRVEGYGDDDNFWSFHLMRCGYGLAEVEPLLRQRLQRKVDRLKGKSFPDRNATLGSQLSRVAWRYAQLAKHEHFRHEDEWRVVVGAPNNEVLYRLSRRGLIPYLYTQKLKIEEVWVGPRAGSSQQRDVLRLLDIHKIRAKVEIWESPYR